MPFRCRVIALVLTLLAISAQIAGAQPAPGSGPVAPSSRAETEASDDDVFADFPESEDEEADEEIDEEAEDAPPTDEEFPYGDVETLTVTSKRTDSVVSGDSASSVTQFSSDDLQSIGATDVSDLAPLTPNLEIRKANSTSSTFFIRGIGLSDYNANAAGSVGIYQDDIPIDLAAMQLSQLFDLQGIDILRGPQGAGPGRNSSAGAIFVNSRKPTGDLNAFLSTSYGNYNAIDVQGALELPIVTDELSTRVAFRVEQRDGWGINRCAGAPSIDDRLADPATYNRMQFCSESLNTFIDAGPNPNFPPQLPPLFFVSPVPGGLPREVNDIGNWAARGLLRYQPDGTEMDWLLIGSGARVDQLSTLGVGYGTIQEYGVGRTSTGYIEPDAKAEQQQLKADCIAETGQSDGQCLVIANQKLVPELARRLDSHPRVGDYNRVGPTMLDTWGVSLDGTVPIGDMTFRTLTGYFGYDRYRDEDIDFTSDRLIERVSDDGGWQLSEELRLEGELDNELFSWELGGYFLMDQLESDADFYLERQTTLQEWTQDMYSFAFYAGFGWDFLDYFTLDAGARYNWERKTFDQSVQTGSVPSIPFPPETKTWQAPTGTVSLTYAPSENLSFYWKYSRGWKGGHFNASSVSQASAQNADPETIDAFEVGANGFVLDGRVGLSTSLFYYSYDDYQVFLVDDNLGGFPQILIVNANNAEIWGAEAEVFLKPLIDYVPTEMENLSITTRFGWLHSEFLDFATKVRRTRPDFDENGNPRPPVTTVALLEYSGNPLLNSPRFKVSLTAEWQFDFGRWGIIAPRYDGAWTDDVFFDPNVGRGVPSITGEDRLPEYATGQPAFWLHGVSLTYRTSNERVELQGWVRNLTDEIYKVNAFDASQFSRATATYLGEPRTFGATVSVFFD